VDSQVVLIAIDLPESLLDEIEHEVDAQARALSRVDIVRESVKKSLIVKATSVEEAFAFSNDYAPEHLILHLQNASEMVALVENAGSVFVGAFSPERYFPRPKLYSVVLTSVLTAVATMRPVRITPCQPTATHDSSAASTRSPSKNISLRRRSQKRAWRNLDRWSSRSQNAKACKRTPTLCACA